MSKDGQAQHATIDPPRAAASPRADERASERFDQTFALLPLFFVLTWSTGFIGMKWALPADPSQLEPMTFLAIRFAIAASILGCAALVLRAPWPRGKAAAHLAVSGILLHAGALGLVFLSLVRGVEAGTSALLSALQPLTIVALGILFLGERIRRGHVVGMTAAVVGVVIVAFTKWDGGTGSTLGYAFAIAQPLVAGCAVAYQRTFVPKFDLRTGTTVQFAAATLFLLPLTLVFESWQVPTAAAYWQGMAWLVLVLSILSVSLLHRIIRAGSVATVANLFFLVPVSAALIAWALFGETLSWLQLLGFAVTVAGVAYIARVENTVKRTAPLER